MTKFFITGTDTNIGKTVISAIVTSALNACYWKPIQAGVATEMSEEEKIKRWIDLPENRVFPPIFKLKAPLSPDQAATLEGVTIDLAKCTLPETDRSVIVEGAGGVFVPVNDSHNMMDLMQQLALPIIVVARGTLGTINHTLLTLEALHKRNLNIKGIVFSGDLNHANQIAIEKWSNVRSLFHVPRFEKISKEILQNWIQQNIQLVLDALR